MRIVIDMQGAQTESRFRGIGRYTLSFAEAIARNRGEHELFLALSGFFPETIEPIRAAFDGLLPQKNIRVWCAPGPVRESDPENKSRREVAELIREAFLASFQPDIVHISNVFEGWDDDGVVSIGHFDQNTPISVFLYEPILQFDAECDHFTKSIYAAYYQRKLDSQKKATICVNATQTTLEEGSKQFQQMPDSFWDETAKQAILAWDSLTKSKTQQKPTNQQARLKPRLAFVSPLPPERTGIADYSAEMISALATYYDIEIIVEQKQVDTPWATVHPERIHDVAWLRNHAQEMDRVVYQMGNSPFHAYMLPLLREIPGAVVLHDFYLSGLMSWLEVVAGNANAWVEALYDAHGYTAVRQRFFDPAATAMQYPVNLQVMQQAQGLIVHSDYSKTLAQLWYGSEFLREVEVIPLIRAPAEKLDKAAARKILDIPEDVFLVCSFGFLGSTKLNHRLLSGFLQSSLAGDERCKLVFVGESNGGDYGANLLQTIRKSDFPDRVFITGFAAPETFHHYLAAADVAVQLRTNSRGETSAAVLDCMNYGLPLIVNANGSMAELNSDAVWILGDEFEDAALINALETLRREPEKRQDFGARAQKIINSQHSPAECAKRYANAIERFYYHAGNTSQALIQAIAGQKVSIADSDLLQVAKNITTTLPIRRRERQLFLDVTVTCKDDLKTGIQRVVRAISMVFLESPPEGYRVEPVYLSNDNGEWHYRYARRYTLGLLDCPPDVLVDEIVEPIPGDILLGLDLSGGFTLQSDAAGLFAEYRNIGVKVYQVVYDLLPVTMPEVFPPDSDRHHASWLHVISKFDGAICISKAVADDLAQWQKKVGINWQDRRPFHVSWFHLGADIANSLPSGGLAKNAEHILRKIKARPSFLMVGTIEPRKGYLQTIEAFKQLWQEGVDVNLVIVGKEGWQNLPRDMRRNIPETISMLRNCHEQNKRLFWLEGISDEYLEKVYAASTCLIAASYGEGFGLPLIEAAQHKLPIIARDITVFREVAGESAYYFSCKEAADLALEIKTWLALFEKNRHPSSINMPWLTWQQSAAQLKQVLIGNAWC